MLVIFSFVYFAPPSFLCFPLVNIFILFLFYNLCIVYSSPIVSGLGLKNIQTNLIRTPALCTWSLLYLHPHRNLNQLSVVFHTPETLKIVTLNGGSSGIFIPIFPVILNIAGVKNRMAMLVVIWWSILFEA